MFETDDTLRTWSTEPVEFDDSVIAVAAHSLVDHRLRYLDFEGDIGGGRGTVTRVIGGEYDLAESSSDRFCVKLRWTDTNQQSIQRTVLIERPEDDPIGSWVLRDCR